MNQIVRGNTLSGCHGCCQSYLNLDCFWIKTSVKIAQKIKRRMGYMWKLKLNNLPNWLGKQKIQPCKGIKKTRSMNEGKWLCLAILLSDYNLKTFPRRRNDCCIYSTLDLDFKILNPIVKSMLVNIYIYLIFPIRAIWFKF